MAALIIGGDRVAAYIEYLQGRGFATIRHWNGRKNSECHRQIPLDTRLVVILTDQVNHSLVKKTKRIANAMRVPIVFSGSGLGQLGEAMASLAP